jgi:Tfp pilus assembly protein PilP
LTGARLVGIFRNNGSSHALISASQKPSITVRTGEFFEGWQVDDVGDSHVVLSNSGSVSKLQLFRPRDKVAIP